MEEVIHDDTVSQAFDPMGKFPVAKQFWKVADYVGGSMAEAAVK